MQPKTRDRIIDTFDMVFAGAVVVAFIIFSATVVHKVATGATCLWLATIPIILYAAIWVVCSVWDWSFEHTSHFKLRR